MDDQNQNNQQPITSTNAQQPVPQQGDVFQAQSVPSVPPPISIPQKEQEPISTGVSQAVEFISPTEKEPVLHQEVKDAGVEATPQPSVSQIAKELGVEQIKENTPVEVDPIKFMKLPITSGSAKQVVSQTGRFRDSILWLAMLILRQIKMAKFKQSLEKKEVK